MVLICALVTAALIRKALAVGRSASGKTQNEGEGSLSKTERKEARRQTPKAQYRNANAQSLPISSVLWLIFILYGVCLIPQSAVPFESKLSTLLCASVFGSYPVFGGALKSFRVSRPLLGTLIFVVMLAALYGLIIHFKNPEQVLWTERHTVYEGRLMSTYICPNHFAHLLQMLLPFCLVLLFIPQAGLYLRLLSGYSLVVFIPTLFLTESRAGWLGSIAAIGMTCLLLALRRSKKLFVLLMILVPLCSTLLLLGAWRFSDTFQRRMKPVTEFIQGQAEEGIGSESRDFRPQTWMDTIDMIKQQPLLGYGPGTYRYAYPEFRKRFRGRRIVTGHPHNEYLELIADYGLMGFGVFALAWLYGLIRILIFSLKTDNRLHAFMAMAFLGTAAGTMVHSFFDFQMHIFPNALVFALLAAVAIGPMAVKQALGTGHLASEKMRNEGDPQRRMDKHPKSNAESLPPESNSPTSNAKRPFKAYVNMALNISLALVFLIGTVFCAQVMGSAYIRALGDRAAEKQDLGRAENFYALATKLDDSNWRIYKGQGHLAYEERYYSIDQAEKPELARLELDRYASAYAANSLDPEIISALAHAKIFLGETEEGLQLLRDACRYRTFNDKYWWNLGVALREAGQYEEAIEVFKHAKRLHNSAPIRENIKWMEAKLMAAGVGKQEEEDKALGVENKTVGQKASWPVTSDKEQKPDDLNELLNIME